MDNKALSFLWLLAMVIWLTSKVSFCQSRNCLKRDLSAHKPLSISASMRNLRGLPMEWVIGRWLRCVLGNRDINVDVFFSFFLFFPINFLGSLRCPALKLSSRKCLACSGHFISNPLLWTYHIVAG